MTTPPTETVVALRKIWTDKFVRVKPGVQEELKRFEGKVGRVVTVNFSGRAIVDFATGPWTDVGSFETVLEEVSDPEEHKKYDRSVNSAQILPGRQG